MAQISVFRGTPKDITLADDSIVDATGPFSISNDNKQTWIAYETKTVLKAGDYSIKTGSESIVLLTQKA